MSWNDCLYAYAKKHGGDYWGRMLDAWDGILRMEYRGEPILIRALATGVGRYEPFYTFSAAFQITLERHFSCKIAPESTMVQGIKQITTRLSLSDSYGCPEITAKRAIKTDDKVFMKRILSNPELRQDLLDLPDFGVEIAPIALDSQYHQVHATVTQSKANNVLPFAGTEVPLFHDGYQPQVPDDFAPALDRLLQLAWNARKAATAWRMEPPAT